MTIELTEEQRQALQAEQGKPVDVVDPATQRRYVLLAQEQYERLRSLLDQPPAAPSESPPAAAVGAKPEGKPLRQHVRELLLPPDVAAEMHRYCTRLGSWKAKNRRQMEEQMKLQHFYGGKWIAYLRTKDGIVVVAAADTIGDPSFERQLSFLTAEERRTAIIDSPTRLFDKESEILTPFPDES